MHMKSLLITMSQWLRARNAPLGEVAVKALNGKLTRRWCEQLRLSRNGFVL